MLTTSASFLAEYLKLIIGLQMRAGEFVSH